jgi:hypothetical protein
MPLAPVPPTPEFFIDRKFRYLTPEHYWVCWGCQCILGRLNEIQKHRRVHTLANIVEPFTRYCECALRPTEIGETTYTLCTFCVRCRKMAMCRAIYRPHESYIYICKECDDATRNESPQVV